MSFLSDAPVELTEQSLAGLKKRGIIIDYETIDGGFRVWMGKKDKVSPLDMSLAEARGFGMGAELSHYLIAKTFLSLG